VTPRTVAFFGSSLLSAYWNGAATYFRGIIKALHGRGYAVTFYEPDAFDRQAHRDIDEPAWASVRVYAGEGEAGVMRALDEASRADIIIKASGVGVHDQLLERGVLECARPGNLVAFWDVDAPATLERVLADPSDPFRQQIPRYDFIFTYGGGSPVIDAYVRLGARLCVPIYNALDPETHHAVDRDARFSADLALLANRLPDREARIDEFFVGPARALPDKAFLLAGNGWGDKNLPTNVRYCGHLYTRDHNAFNCTPLAVLNVNRDSMARYGFSPATRVFEAAGAAACIITDAFKGIELFLEPGREVLVAASGDEVAEIVRTLTPRRADELGRAAQFRVLSAHTYAHRVLELERLLGSPSAEAISA
jgi:spore maturation protein CgeB